VLSPGGLRQRSELLQAIRSFFYEQGYLEVDTPIRLPVLIPESHILPFSSEGWFLHTSPEICMKRLLAAGNEQLFQISRCFRKEEVGRLHQSEFSMVEWYHKGWSYLELMEECERFISAAVASGIPFTGIAGGKLLREGRSIPLAPPWERITVAEVFQDYAGISAREAVMRGDFDELLVTLIEPRLGWERPVFLYDYPVELGSLARRKTGNKYVAERFELYIAGIELANGFSELVDPVEQRERFVREIDYISKMDRYAAAMPEKFLDDLGRMGMAAGVSLGLDRLFMLLCGLRSVAEAVCFGEEDL